MGNEMKIVYVDPGYGKLCAYPPDISSAYSAFTGKLTWVKNKTFNPTSDVAFTHDSDVYYASSRATVALLPAGVLDLALPAKVEGKYVKRVLSLKCLVYFAPKTPNLEIGFIDNLTAGFPIGVTFSDTSTGGHANCRLTNFDKYKDYSASSSPKFTADSRYDVSITYSWAVDDRGTSSKLTRSSNVTVSGFSTTKGSVTSVTLEDDKVFTSTPTTVPKMCLLYRSMSKPHSYVSNVLVGQAYYVGDGSDLPKYEGIPVDTRIYRLTTSATDTDFSSRTIETEVASIFGGQTTLESNTEYYTNTNGAKLLQQISSSGDTPANHIVVYGNPGYHESGAVTKATGIERTIAHGTHTLSSEKDAHVCDWWKDDNAETLSDFYGKYVGWKAGG